MVIKSPKGFVDIFVVACFAFFFFSFLFFFRATSVAYGSSQARG